MDMQLASSTNVIYLISYQQCREQAKKKSIIPCYVIEKIVDSQLSTFIIMRRYFSIFSDQVWRNVGSIDRSMRNHGTVGDA
jgi:hypothetical protein